MDVQKVATVIVEDMTADEAQLCLLAIRGNLESARRYTLDLDRRNGWKALGYSSLAACFEALLGISFQHGYRLLAAYEVEEHIQALSPMGEKVMLKSRWVADSGIHKLQPAQQAEAYELAKRLHAAERSARMVGRHIVAAVAEIRLRESVLQAPYPLIAERVAGGQITATVGGQLVEALDRLPPVQRAPLVELMAAHDLSNPALVGPLGTLFGRKADKPSLMLPEVLTGYLGGVALAQATLTDWQRAAQEARMQHMAERLNEQTDSIQPVLVTLYIGDARRTVRELRETLGVAIYRVRDILCEELMRE